MVGNVTSADPGPDLGGKWEDRIRTATEIRQSSASGPVHGPYDQG